MPPTPHPFVIQTLDREFSTKLTELTLDVMLKDLPPRDFQAYANVLRNVSSFNRDIPYKKYIKPLMKRFHAHATDPMAMTCLAPFFCNATFYSADQQPFRAAMRAPLPYKTAMTLCDQCGEFCTLSCKGCRLATYCNRKCQRAAWPEHQKVCYRDGAENLFDLARGALLVLEDPKLVHIMLHFLGMDGPHKRSAAIARRHIKKKECVGSIKIILAKNGEVADEMAIRMWTERKVVQATPPVENVVEVHPSSETVAVT
jgi:hypothetical protein